MMSARGSLLACCMAPKHLQSPIKGSLAALQGAQAIPRLLLLHLDVFKDHQDDQLLANTATKPSF